MKVTLELESVDLRCLVVAAARYSFRRMTYMPGIVAGIVERNMEAIDVGTRGILARDIREEMELDELCADVKHWHGVAECWKSLLPLLEEES